MRQIKKGFVLIAALLLLAGCSSGKADDRKTAPETEPGVQEEKGEPGGLGEDGLGEDGLETGISQTGESSQNPQQRAAICGQYFKQGDFRFRMEITPGGPEDREQLEVIFYEKTRDAVGSGFSNSLESIHRFSLPYRMGTASYQVQEESGEQSGGSYTIKLHPDIVVELIGDSGAAGMYYSYEGNLRMPDAFNRPLNETDLIGLEPGDLKILRNEFYAVYGRIFKTEELRNYFSSKPWYRGTVEAEAFDDALLGGLYRRNISFLQESEESYDPAQAKKVQEAYAGLKPAPYLEVLPEYGEVYVNLASDAAHAEDRGIYYAAMGTISAPITFTPEQHEAMERGETIELTVDELTGEKKRLRKAPEDQSYGDYLLGEETDEDYVMAAYQPDNDAFYLWADSADTRFKRVYEGEIYVLKGACEEYRGYFDMPRSERGEGPGAFRVMDFNEAGAYGPEPYSGNVLVTDAKGYIKALYFFGD